MRKLFGSSKILLFCLIMYMLLVLPVFADGMYSPHVPNYTNQYLGEYPTNYPGMAQGDMYRAQPVPVQTYHPAQVAQAAYGQAYHPPHSAQGGMCEFCGMYVPQRGGKTAPLRTLNNYRGRSSTSVGKQYAYGEQGTYTPPSRKGDASFGSVEEVWMRTGGARMQFNALDGPTQMYTNGKPVQDPALVYLPPLYPNAVKKPRQRARRAVKKQNIKTQNVASQHVQVQHVQVQNVQIQYVGTPPPGTLPQGALPSGTSPAVTPAPSAKPTPSTPKPMEVPSTSKAAPATKPATPTATKAPAAPEKPASANPAPISPTQTTPKPATSAASKAPIPAISATPASTPANIESLVPNKPPVAAPYEGSAQPVGG